MKKNRKRGVAIELAIALLVIFFSTCLLLVTMTLATRKTVREQISNFKEEMQIEQIAEDFVATYAAERKKDPTLADFRYVYSGSGTMQKYGAEMTMAPDGECTLRIYHNSKTFTRLTVTVEPEGTDGYRVTTWSRVVKKS